MKTRNLVLGLMLVANVLTAHSAMMVSTATTAAIVASNTAVIASHNNMQSSEKTIDAVSSTILNSRNTVIVECPLENDVVKKDDEWIGNLVPSLEKTLKNSYCQSNKKTMEQLNNVHYKFGKVKGIFDVSGTNHVMIELVEVNE